MEPEPLVSVTAKAATMDALREAHETISFELWRTVWLASHTVPVTPGYELIDLALAELDAGPGDVR